MDSVGFLRQCRCSYFTRGFGETNPVVNERWNYKRSRRTRDSPPFFWDTVRFNRRARDRSQFANNLHESLGNFGELRGEVVRSINHTKRAWRERKKEPAANFPRKTAVREMTSAPRVLESFRLIAIITT